MRKKIFSIWSVLLILVISIAVLVPGCGETTEKCTIYVEATVCDEPWTGAVGYTLAGPGATAPTIINGTAVNATHSGVDCGQWICANVTAPPGTYLVDITPNLTQTVSGGGNITFTLNFEENQDAWIDLPAQYSWTAKGVPIPGGPEYYEYEAMACDIIDVHFMQGVLGCEGYEVAVNETSRLWIHYAGWTDSLMVPPECQIVPDPVFYVVNDLCAVNKTALEGPTPKKVSQNTTHKGDFVNPGGEPIYPVCCEIDELDVETIWTLVKEVDYEKSINWFGISLFDPLPHPCVLFELVIPFPVPGWYCFELVASADVELMDDVDANPQNNSKTSPPLYLTVFVP